MKARFDSIRILTGCLLLIGSAMISAAPVNGQIISKQEAIEKAQKIRSGRVLSIKLHNKPPAPPEYRVKILHQGDVHLLNIDARPAKSR